jgi:1-deoxy-D-xylulose-5-phosphate reductoisomerase
VNEDMRQVNRLILTASGGPFRNLPTHEFATITRERALRHPKWTMGAKITIDSSTLMNKGLEVIEAHHLFSIPYDQISVIIHPQSIIHSMVEFSDGTILSQMGLPDMRFPIQYALSYPHKWPNPWPKTKLSDISPLEFFEPDFEKFPLLQLAFDCGTQGGSAPAVMNAANEAAVGLFLQDRISYAQITHVVSNTVDQFTHFEPTSLDQIVTLDAAIKTQIHTQFATR